MEGPIGRKLEELNRLRCIVSVDGSTYKLRIENVNHEPLTDWAERTREETKYVMQGSGDITFKEDLHSLDNGGEDYRIPIIDEAILRDRLYPGD